MIKKLQKHSYLYRDEGQTAVEYILLVGVVVIIILSIMGIVKEKLLGDGQNCSESSEAIVCKINKLINPETNFKYFPLRQ